MFVSQLTSFYIGLCLLVMRTHAITANNCSSAAQAKGAQELPTAQHISHNWFTSKSAHIWFIPDSSLSVDSLSWFILR